MRVTRKNSDPHSVYGVVYIYDGLYDVVWLPTYASFLPQ